MHTGLAKGSEWLPTQTITSEVVRRIGAESASLAYLAEIEAQLVRDGLADRPSEEAQAEADPR